MGDISAHTFLDELKLRHDAFRPVEDAGGEMIRHEMQRVANEMKTVFEKGIDTVTDQGRYLSKSEARYWAKARLEDIEDVLTRGIGRVDNKLLSLKEGAFIRGVTDFKSSIEFAPGMRAGRIESSFSQLYPEAAEAAITNPVLGIRPSHLWNGVEAGTIDNVRRTLLQAVTTGESIEQTARRLSQGLDVTVNAAERIARTSLNSMYNDAHIRVINTNSDIFAGYRWLAALDDRTSPICIRLHGTFFPIGTQPPGPPAHWNCRSILQPVFKNPEIQASMIDDRQRVKSYDGDGNFKEVFIRANTSADKWLKRQPKWVSQQVLGSRLKADLFYSGKAKITDIVSPAMQVLRDKDLVRRLAALKPRDKELQLLARQYGVDRIPSKALIEAEDRALARAQWFQQPTEMPDVKVAPPVQTELPAPTQTAPKDPLPEDRISNEKLVDDWRALEVRRETQQASVARWERRYNQTVEAAGQGPRSARDLADELAKAKASLDEARAEAAKLKALADDAWAKIEGQIPADARPARLPDEWLHFKLNKLGMTRDEVSALKFDLDELDKAHREALKAGPPRALPAPGPDALQSERKAWNLAQTEERMNYELANKSADMARARVVTYRAQQEMGDVFERMTVGDRARYRAQRVFKNALKEAAGSTKYQAAKDDIVATMKTNLAGRVPERTIEEIEWALRDTLDMMDDKLFETHFAEKWRQIKWAPLPANERSFAEAVYNVLNVNEERGVATWMHEFGHHVEFRTKSKETIEGWRAWMAWKNRSKTFYGSTGVVGEDGWIGPFYHDYVGKVYSDGYTQIASMGLQALNDTTYGQYMLDNGPDHYRILWALFRGMCRWDG